MNAKLDTARVFERIFAFYGSQFTLLIPAALVLFVPVALLNALLLSSGDAGPLELLLTVAIATVATYWYQGMVVEATRDILDGRRDHTIGSLFRSAAPFIAPLLAVGILAGIAIAIGFVLLIVPGLILLTIWAVIVPVIVIERTGVFGSFGRSRELVRGSGWQVFGVIVVLFLLNIVLTAIVNAIVGGVSDDSFGGYFASDLIVRVLIAPLSALAATVIYAELRRVRGDPLPEEAAGTRPARLPPLETPSDPRGPQAASDPRGPQAASDPRGPQAASDPRGPQAASDPRGPQAPSDPRGPEAPAP